MMMLDRMAVPAETQSGKRRRGGGDIFSFQLSKGQSRPHTNTRKKERRKGTNRNSPNIRGESHFLHGNKRLKSGIRLSPKFEINVRRSNLFFPAKRHYISFDEAGETPASVRRTARIETQRCDIIISANPSARESTSP